MTNSAVEKSWKTPLCWMYFPEPPSGMTDLHKDAGNDVRIWSPVGQLSLGIVLAEENFLIQDNTSF